MSLRSLALPVDEISARLIKPSQDPLRQDLGDIESLCRSIEDVGLLQPIVVRSAGERFEVVAGNRRFEACRRLKWRRIPCQLVELTEKEAFEVALAENLERRTLDPLEEARAFQRYVSRAGWGGAAELSRRIRRSPAYISKRMRLLSIDPEALETLFRRRKGTALAEEMFMLGADQQRELAEEVERNPMSTREVRRLVKSIREAPSGAVEGSWWKAQEDKQRLVARSIDQTISAFRLALSRIDVVIERLEKEWVEKEVLMQYRFSLHSQIDSLIHLRKKLAAN
ncbi:MAG: ParB/RepB/Spo0J family partition protein [Nitrososphaerota archaeon]|nr:ParB/RepB/Spo0J family partition protein [Nitrososphaerota archaeon]MCL5672657.1 ParB/RepB/Spo0J family partition protein [Nitrososphaerota archaeon]MDG6909648.1 ParB/RepB/Spo0J family partition protein [Nitrososphaerota archaeon]MDG7003126.1 ParB/RepB/Spo0J family partition protein [Nitrososphaerota archaeon]MDG7019734.1 ParB/RepB/Spo0J family partition protein [Nitrososphaerota archaeon]